MTTNPRWVCPLCRQPAYQLRLDRILLAILIKYHHIDNLTEVYFFRNGQYTIPGEYERRNIDSLNVENLRKRQREISGSGEEEGEGEGEGGRKLGRKEVVISLL